MPPERAAPKVGGHGAAAGGRILVGTAGWSYPTGHGTWNGIFYPAPAAAGRGGRGRFDELAYYAERFRTVEVNSSFYRPPTAATSRGWASRTPRDFVFSVKLYQRFTHPAMFERTAGEGTWTVRQEDLDQFRRGIEPLARAGKLGALLAQFPPSFAETPETRDYLGWLLEAFRDYAMAVELRHRSWSDRLVGTLELLGEHGAAWVQIDEPKFHFSIRQDLRPNVASFYYMRLHGRNAEKWWRHEAAEERYDYLYSPDELKTFAHAASQASRQTRKLYIYMNNHFAAKAVANAVILRHQLGESTPGEFPSAFVERYPDLAGLVATSRSLLSPS